MIKFTVQALAFREGYQGHNSSNEKHRQAMARYRQQRQAIGKLPPTWTFHTYWKYMRWHSSDSRDH